MFLPRYFPTSVVHLRGARRPKCYVRCTLAQPACAIVAGVNCSRGSSSTDVFYCGGGSSGICYTGTTYAMGCTLGGYLMARLAIACRRHFITQESLFARSAAGSRSRWGVPTCSRPKQAPLSDAAASHTHQAQVYTYSTWSASAQQFFPGTSTAVVPFVAGTPSGYEPSLTNANYMGVTFSWAYQGCWCARRGDVCVIEPCRHPRRCPRKQAPIAAAGAARAAAFGDDPLVCRHPPASIVLLSRSTARETTQV